MGVKSYFVMTWFKETTWIFVYMHGDLKTVNNTNDNLSLAFYLQHH